MSIYQNFVVAAELHRDKPALVAGEMRITYGELSERVDALVDTCVKAGIGSGSRVCILLPNSVAFVEAALATWKLGAVVVPLHIKFQEQEIRRYIKDCGVRVLITHSELDHLVESLRSKDALIDRAVLTETDAGDWRIEGAIESDAAAAAAPEVLPDDAALTQYSTGSTGLPKRVTRSHSQVVAEFESVAEAMKIRAEDRILGVAPFFHSYGLINCLVCSMLSGATLYPMRDFFAKDVSRIVDEESITGFPGVPFMYQILVESKDSRTFASLRYALSAGAPLSEKTGLQFQERFGVSVRQLYGSTETGVISINRGSGSAASISSVGFPIPGVVVDIVDDDDQKVPLEIEGNIAVKSPFGARFYDGDTVSTESKFIDGYFFPGDIGWLSDEGRIVITGRKRMFINVGGNKVDPSEVEDVLREHPAIADVAVVGIPDEKGGETVKAVIVSPTACSRIAILKHCKDRIAEFKHPRIVEFRTEIPKNPMGKVLRKYLVEEAEQPQPQHTFNVRSGFRRKIDSEPDSTSVDVGLLPPLLRVLCVTDGTVTKTLEAYFWEPITVDRLKQSQAPSPRDEPDINLSKGDMLIQRQVILRGAISGRAYAYAKTLMRSDGVGSEFTQKLVDGQIGIGELLRDRRIDTYREVVSVERILGAEWAEFLAVAPAEYVVKRKYLIYHAQQPAIMITEVFPESRYSQERGQAT